jgi:hypothetical protein
MSTEDGRRLYDRVGGVYTIAVVVDDFIDRVMNDDRLTRTRASTRRITAFRRRASSTT